MLNAICRKFKSFSNYWNYHKAISLAVIITFSSSIVSPVFAEVAVESIKDDVISFAEKTERLKEESDSSIPVYQSSKDEDSNGGAASDSFDDEENISVVVVGFMPEIITTKEGQEGIVTLPDLKDDLDKEAKEMTLPATTDPKFVGADMNSNYAGQYLTSAAPFLGNEVAKKVFGRQMKALVFAGPLKPVMSAGEASTFIQRDIADFVRSGMYKEALKAAKTGDHKEAGEIVKRGVMTTLMLWPAQFVVGCGTGPMFERLGMRQDVAANLATYSKGHSMFSGIHEFSGKTAEAIVSLEHPEYKWVPTVMNAGTLFASSKWFSQNIFNMLQNAGVLAAGANIDDPSVKLMILTISEAIASSVTTAATLGMAYFDPAYSKYKLFELNSDSGSSNELVPFSNNVCGDSDRPSRIGKMVESGLSEFYPAVANTAAGGLNIILTSLVGGNGALADKATFDVFNLYAKSLIATNSLSTKDMLIRANAQGETAETKWGMINTGLLVNAALNIPYIVMMFYPGLVSSTEAGKAMVPIWAGKAIVESFERDAKADLAAFKQKDQGWTKTFSDWTPVVLTAVEFTLVKSGAVNPTVQVRRTFTYIGCLTSIFSFLALFNLGM